MQWEYLAAQVDYKLYGGELVALVRGEWVKANVLGKQGWELVSVVKDMLGPNVAIFKRRVDAV